MFCPLARAFAQDQMIEDPELASAPAPEAISGKPSAPAPDAASQHPDSEVHLTLHARGNRDLRQDDPREEIWESTTLAVLDATLRRSDSLRFGIGLVARYHVASLAHAVSDAQALRYEFDVMPSAAYVDVTPASGLHVRAGYQPVHLGRFEIFGANDVLSVRDLRDGPATLPEMPEIGQLSLLIDYDLSSWFSLRAIYVPLFMPDLINVTESDYALFPNKQANTDAAFAAFDNIVPSDQLRAFLANNLSRAGREHIASGGLAAFAPGLGLQHPQAALRATAHGNAGEFALTFSTALEHVPAFRLSDRAISTVTMQTPAAGSQNQPDPHPITVEYNRFAILSADAALDVSPFSIGFELAYMLHRTLYALGTAYANDPLSVPVPDSTDLAQLGGRIEYVQSAHWLFALEGFVSYAMSLPRDPQRGWVFFESGRFLRGTGGVLGYTTDFGLSLQLAAAWFSGPSLIVAPRIAYGLFERFELEVGALIIKGQASAPYATPIMALGGVFSNLDHVFVGVRYQL
jgi:hypothetical protein